VTDGRVARREPGRLLIAAIAALGVAVGIAAEYVAIHGLYEYSPVDAVRDVAVGWSYIGAGLIAWRRRPTSRIGPLMIVVGFTWFVGNFGSAFGLPGFPSDGPAMLVVAIASSFGGLQRAFQTMMIVSYPTGRLTDLLERAFVAATFVVIVGNGFIMLTATDPATLDVCDGPCPPSPALLFPDRALAGTLLAVGSAGELAVSLGLLVILVRRWVRSTPSARRTLGPVWFSALVVGMAFIGLEIAIRLGADPSMGANVIQGLQIAVPFAFLVGLLRTHLAHAAIGDLVVDLSRSRSPADIRDALARTLGDPGLRLAFPIGGPAAYLDSEGRPMSLPVADSQSTHELRRDGETIGIIVHDRALDEDPGLVEAAGAAAMFAIENARLQVELRSQLDEVRASRSRIVRAGDVERRKVERDLHDGAQQRLATLALALRLARERAGLTEDRELERLLDEAASELNTALRELRELARGIHPAILTEEGLGAAVESLATRSPIPVQVDVGPSRYPTAVEATAYFVVCEALANVFKHARATEVTVRAESADGRLRIEVADDGLGGADPSRGSGLRGLADRVSAGGGSLRFESPHGRGTVVVAEIPCV
jgi:signal transduction histidine kinase